VPLGLSQEDREEFLRSTPERKFDLKDEKVDERLYL